MDTILNTVAPARRTGRRPNFPLDFKRRVVEATFQPGASVLLLAVSAGASKQDVAEVIMVATALRAGGGGTHGWQAMRHIAETKDVEAKEL